MSQSEIDWTRRRTTAYLSPVGNRRGGSTNKNNGGNRHGSRREEEFMRREGAQLGMIYGTDEREMFCFDLSLNK